MVDLGVVVVVTVQGKFLVWLLWWRCETLRLEGTSPRPFLERDLSRAWSEGWMQLLWKPRRIAHMDISSLLRDRKIQQSTTARPGQASFHVVQCGMRQALRDACFGKPLRLHRLFDLVFWGREDLGNGEATVECLCLRLGSSRPQGCLEAHLRDRPLG